MSTYRKRLQENPHRQERVKLFPLSNQDSLCCRMYLGYFLALSKAENWYKGRSIARGNTHKISARSYRAHLKKISFCGNFEAFFMFLLNIFCKIQYSSSFIHVFWRNTIFYSLSNHYKQIFLENSKSSKFHVLAFCPIL